jgi:hypothetical protein
MTPDERVRRERLAKVNFIRDAYKSKLSQLLRARHRDEGLERE